MEIFVDILLMALAVTSGFLAVGFMVVALRAGSAGRAAYEANRRATFSGVIDSALGKLREPDGIIEPRTQHGMVLNIKTGEVELQQRLSQEAMDDVIAAKV